MKPVLRVYPPFRQEKLPGSPQLDELARAAKALGKPGVARDVCDAALQRVGA